MTTHAPGPLIMTRGAGNYRRFTDADKAQMTRLRSEGKTYAEIAKAMSETIKRIGDWFRLSRDAPGNIPQPRRKIELPVASDGFITPPTRAQLMGRR